ncbi:MAG: TetR/AcrR family transcriptional regulator [Pseudomonadota bacterium]
MARPRTFDCDEVIVKASYLFTRQGFAATTMDQLAATTGASLHSLYADYGGKKGLFEATLKTYLTEDIIRGVMAPLLAEGAGFEDLQRFFDALAQVAKSGERDASCLICLTMMRMDDDDPEVRGVVQAYLQIVDQAFRNVLGNAKQAGAARADLDIAKSAAFLTGILLGLNLYLRSPAGAERIEDYLSAALASLH